MDNTIPLHLQEVIFSSKEPAISRRLTQLEREGKLRKISPRIYTPIHNETPETIVNRNLFKIVGQLYPGALLSHRSAIECKPTPAKLLFLTYTYTKKIDLPGVTLSFIKGQGPIAGDNIFTDGLFRSQTERAILENLQESRITGPESKALTLPEIEEQLEKIARLQGEEGLNEFRDKARELSEQLGLEKEFKKLNKLISAMLSTQPAEILTTPAAIARASGKPYDSARVALFEKVATELEQRQFENTPDQNSSLTAFRNFAFYDAYFSNYIEGTEFEIEEARQIIETDTPLPARNEDSHDILGTYKILSSPEEMRVTPETPEELLEILRYRHKVLLSARTDKNPGQFKDKNNHAGNTHFVDFNLVRGTLVQGFSFYKNLTDPFTRALFMKFMVSEVHPFLDGNGRISRVMMNAELVKAGQTRIMIPTVYREDYIGATRQLSRQGLPDAYIRMLQRAMKFSATIVSEDINFMQTQLEESNAFSEPDEAKLKIIEREEETFPEETLYLRPTDDEDNTRKRGTKR